MRNVQIPITTRRRPVVGTSSRSDPRDIGRASGHSSDPSLPDVGRVGMTGPEVIDEIIKFPTLDWALDRSPFSKPLSRDEYVEMIKIERLARAQFQLKKQKAREKKQGIEEHEDASKGDNDGG